MCDGVGGSDSVTIQQWERIFRVGGFPIGEGFPVYGELDSITLSQHSNGRGYSVCGGQGGSDSVTTRR